MKRSNGRLASPGRDRALVGLTCDGRGVAGVGVDIPSILHIYVGPVGAVGRINVGVDISGAVGMGYRFRRGMECG